MRTEAVIQAEVRKRAGELGIHLFRNNVGACQDTNGRIIRYGLANDSAAMSERIKSSDLIGWLPGGRFVAVECKREGWTLPARPSKREEAQLRFIEMVKTAGGVAGFASSVQDFDNLVLSHV